MKFDVLIAPLCAGITMCLFLLSCDKDDDQPSCDVFSSADSVCFCTKNPTDLQCNEISNTTFTIAAYTEEKPELTPHPSNGTIWTKGFAIGDFIYLIDRESTSPHAFWKFDLNADADWVSVAAFPGTGYGLTGSANGKGYASSYASNKFWEYDPTGNAWTPMTDLPFSASETHWVEYQGKFYAPDNDGVFEFNPGTKEWTKFSDEDSNGFGAVFIIGADMYWWNVNDEEMSHLNMTTKAYDKVAITDSNFNSSVTFHSPFVIDEFAFVVSNSTLWIFDNTTRTWVSDEDLLVSGSAYVDDAFVVDDQAYLMDNGYLKAFEPE
jgi:hypothetical protein